LSSPVRPRIVAIAIAVMIAVAGCSTTNVITTKFDYAASDGVQVELGDIRGYNLLFVASAEGERGVLLGSLVNHGTESVDISLSADGTTTTDITIAAGEIVYLGPDEGQALVAGPSLVTPGLSATIGVLTDSTGPVTISVPSVDGTLAEYAAVLGRLAQIAPPEPSPSPEPSAEPSSSPSPEPTASPEPDSE
jgi:hypothetical protein